MRSTTNWISGSSLIQQHAEQQRRAQQQHHGGGCYVGLRDARMHFNKKSTWETSVGQQRDLATARNSACSTHNNLQNFFKSLEQSRQEALDRGLPLQQNYKESSRTLRAHDADHSCRTHDPTQTHRPGAESRTVAAAREAVGIVQSRTVVAAKEAMERHLATASDVAAKTNADREAQHPQWQGLVVPNAKEACGATTGR